jgi:small-conductance mechanosensitive channel
MQILHDHPDVLRDPEPMVFFAGLGESSLDFVLLFWIGNYSEGRRIKSEILFRIFALLKENRISIPFPQRDIHVKYDLADIQDNNQQNLQAPGSNQ